MTVVTGHLAVLRRSCGAVSDERVRRRGLGWSLVLLLVMCAVAYLRSTGVLSWMVVY